MDAPKKKSDLIQAWHMQRALLLKQGLEMEQLRKEKDFIIKCPKCGEKISSGEMGRLKIYSAIDDPEMVEE